MTGICQFIGKPYVEVPDCDITKREPIWYTFYLTGVLYTLTSSVTVVTYAVILRAATRQRVAVQANVHSSAQTSGAAILNFDPVLN